MKKLITILASAAIILCIAGTAMAGTIVPLYPTTDIYHLEDQFVTTNIELVEGSTDMAVFTLFQSERFADSAIRSIQPGDVIVTDGEEVTVNTIDEDGPDFIFNKDTADEMLFCDAGDGIFEHVAENDLVPDIRLGSFQIELLDYFPFLDSIDPMTGEPLDTVAVRSGEDLRNLLADPDAVGFSTHNVRVLYDNNNKPRLIWRFYSPLQ